MVGRWLLRAADFGSKLLRCAVQRRSAESVVGPPLKAGLPAAATTDVELVVAAASAPSTSIASLAALSSATGRAETGQRWIAAAETSVISEPATSVVETDLEIAAVDRIAPVVQDASIDPGRITGDGERIG